MQKIRKILSVALLILLGLFGLIQLVKPAHSFSETERRLLQERPEFTFKRWFSGDFAEDSNKYLLDQVSGRDGWLSIKGEFQHFAGAGDNGRVYFAADNYLPEMNTQLDEERLQRNIGDMLQFTDTYFPEQKNKRASLVLAPTLAGVFPELLPPLAPEAKQPALLSRAAAQAEEGGLRFPRVHASLNMAKTGGNMLYFRTDHHWTQHGARAAYAAWRMSTGKADPGLDYVTVLQSKDFCGTTLAKGKRIFYTPDRLESYEESSLNACRLYDADGELLREGIYNPEALDSYDKYTYFVGENRDFLRIETGRKGAGHLLLFKDSYANAMIPFLCAHFETITVVDLRYYSETMDELMARGPYDELLFVYNIVTLANDNNTFKLLK